MMSERPSGGGGGGGGDAGVSIGNYKGVMLCNRPFAGATGTWSRWFLLRCRAVHSLDAPCCCCVAVPLCVWCCQPVHTATRRQAVRRARSSLVSTRKGFTHEGGTHRSVNAK